MQASAKGLCECAGAAVHVSLRSRLSSSTVDLCLEEKTKGDGA